MTDLVKLLPLAGDGGDGRVSFRREKFVAKGGPDGGNGGRGGSIILRATSKKASLHHISGRNIFEADKGENGGKRQKFGSDAEDLIIEVPVGTVVWLVGENDISAQRRMFVPREGMAKFPTIRARYQLEKETEHVPFREPDVVRVPPEAEEQLQGSINQFDLRTLPKEKLFELTEEGQEVVVCQGGQGGKGNVIFKSSRETTPLFAEYGEVGEQKLVILEQKLLADIGLVGFPNAGKSTLLSVLTKAHPEIANYPFTTRQPNLGIWLAPSGRSYIIADIPGLIEGASQGKGLGYQFLRHVEHSQMLWYVLSLEESSIYAEGAEYEPLAQELLQQWNQLKKELREFHPELLEKPYEILINKIDIYPSELIEIIEKVFEKEDQKVYFLSGATRHGLNKLPEPK